MRILSWSSTDSFPTSTTFVSPLDYHHHHHRRGVEIVRRIIPHRSIEIWFIQSWCCSWSILLSHRAVCHSWQPLAILMMCQFIHYVSLVCLLESNRLVDGNRSPQISIESTPHDHPSSTQHHHLLIRDHHSPSSSHRPVRWYVPGSSIEIRLMMVHIDHTACPPGTLAPSVVPARFLIDLSHSSSSWIIKVSIGGWVSWSWNRHHKPHSAGAVEGLQFMGSSHPQHRLPSASSCIYLHTICTYSTI